MRIKKLENITELDNYPETSLFESKKWLQLITSFYNFPVTLLLNDIGDIKLVTAETKKLYLSKFHSLPFSDYVIPNFSNAKEFNAGINYVKEKLKAPLNLSFKIVTQDLIDSLTFPFQQSAWCHTVDTSNKVMIHKNMDNSFLRGIQKAEKNDLTVRFNVAKEAVERFYKLFHDLRIYKFKKIPQSKSWFLAVWETFIKTKNGFIIEVLKDEMVIASAIILVNGQLLYYKYGASHKDHLKLRPNNILFDQLFLYAYQHGFTQVDLGISGISDAYEGLRRFKSYMGGVEQPIYTYSHQPETFDDSLEAKIDKITSLLTEEIVGLNLPIEKTSEYSEILYPYFA